MPRQDVMLDGIAALRDATRALRGGSGRAGPALETDRGALFDLASLADRLTAFADDQSADDWEEFWVTTRDVATLRRHVDAVTALPRGVNELTIVALRRLAETLDTLVQPTDTVTE